VIVLLGGERFNKLEYSSWKKVYEFEVAFGISTDSYDGMGLINDVNFLSTANIGKQSISKVLKTLVGPYEQRVPLYSSQKVKGKKLFLYPKEGLPVPDLPTKKGAIYNFELLDVYDENLKNLVDAIIKKIESITGGEFRQKEVISDWERFLKRKGLPKKICVAKIRVEVSSGLYVRSLSQDITERLSTVGFVCSLVRVKNGKYTKKDCKILDQVFSEDISKKDLGSKFKT
jgi:tRNA pseudouridine55 synthase